MTLRVRRQGELCETPVVVLALTRHTGLRLAEVGFLLILFAGVWLVVAQTASSGFARVRTIVVGLALTIAGVLLIVATHWGHFGAP